MRTIKECEIEFCTFNKNFMCALPTPPSVTAGDKSECALVWLTSMFFDGNKTFLECKAKYCFYNRRGLCTLPEPPGICDQGMCEEISFISVDEDIIESKKDEIQRNKNR